MIGLVCPGSGGQERVPRARDVSAGLWGPSRSSPRQRKQGIALGEPRCSRVTVLCLPRTSGPASHAPRPSAHGGGKMLVVGRPGSWDLVLQPVGCQEGPARRGDGSRAAHHRLPLAAAREDRLRRTKQVSSRKPCYQLSASCAWRSLTILELIVPCLCVYDLLVCPALGFLLAAQTRMYYKDAKFAPLFLKT